MTLACSLFASATPALAAGATFEVAPVLELLKREIAGSEALASEGKTPLRIEEAQADLDLVEVAGKMGPRLMVPGSDFGVGKEDAPKPALKRRVVVEVTPLYELKPAQPVSAGNSPANATPAAGSGLAGALQDLRAGLQAGLNAPPAYDIKRIGLDLDFALDRNAKGAPSIIVLASDRRIEPKNVQKLRLKLSAREK